MNSSGPAARPDQRRLLRQRRAALSAAERAAAARAILRHVATTRWLARGRRIGAYLPHGSELDMNALRALAHRRGCQIYLPRIVHYRHRQLRFYRDDTGDISPTHPARGSAAAARRNRHGILEPAATGTSVDVRRLSLLFLPLVGFDGRGTRLGSGQGYFDRALQFRRMGGERRPLLVGLAFACQQLAHIERQPHDVPLDAVVTEAGIRFFDGEHP